MTVRRQALAVLLSVAVVGCSHSALIFEADDDAPEDDAGMSADGAVDGGPELDAGTEEAGPAETDAGTESVGALAAHEQTCTVRPEGTFCWGPNEDGQLGIGAERTAAFRPARLERAARYSQLCTGERHSCGLRSDGSLDCWGGNARGQLGLGDRTPRDEPTPVRSSVDFRAISCGGQLTCALGRDEQLYCWGDNFEGQLGQDDPGDSADLSVPTRVAIERGIAQVSVGQGHVCAVTNAGALYCWGRNLDGQLGLGRGASMQVRKPTPLAGTSSYLSVAAGQRHSCAVRKDKRLFCWGARVGGLLGLGAGSESQPEPLQVGDLSDYQSVQANWFHSCALRSGGVLMCWGRNVEAQLGVGDTDLREVPTRVSGSDGFNAFAVGHFHSCASRAGGLYCWGKNDDGQVGLGLDAMERPNVPTRLSF